MATGNASAQAGLLRTALAASRETREINVLMRELKAEARGEADRTVDVGAA